MLGIPTRVLALARVLAILTAVLQAQRASVNAQTGSFSSTEFPSIQIRVDKQLKYLGSFPFSLENTVAGNRYMFAQVDKKNRIHHAFIVQTEGFLVASSDTYKYKISKPASLGGQLYQHNVVIYNEDENVRMQPGHESDLTQKFFKSKGLTWGPGLVMSRFARPVGDEKRHEIILFYFEDLTDYHRSVRDFGDNKNSGEAEKIKNAVNSNSRRAFTVTADKD